MAKNGASECRNGKCYLFIDNHRNGVLHAIRGKRYIISWAETSGFRSYLCLEEIYSDVWPAFQTGRFQTTASNNDDWYYGNLQVELGVV